MSRTTNLTDWEQRGLLAYTVLGFPHEFFGWVQLDTSRTKVIARKVGGRNRWQLANSSDVVSFKTVESINQLKEIQYHVTNN